MKHTEIDRATFRNVGGDQGYVGISVRLGSIDCPVNGPATPIVEMALLPTPAELAALNAGQPLIVQQIGTMVTPFMVYVEGVDYAETAAGKKRWTQQEDLFLHAYFDAVGDMIGPHDLGRPAGAATKRVEHLKRTGAWAALNARAQAERDYRVLAGRKIETGEEA